VITNDIVNLSNTLAGGLLGGLAYLLLF